MKPTTILEDMQDAVRLMDIAGEKLQNIHRKERRLLAVTTTELRLIQLQLNRTTARLYYLITGE